jgi:hypothetical protein
MWFLLTGVIFALNLREVNPKELDKLVLRGSPVFAFAVNRSDLRSIQLGEDLAIAFKSRGTFVFYSENAVASMVNRTAVRIPFFSYFSQSAWRGAFHLPQSIDALKKILNSLFLDIQDPITSPEDLDVRLNGIEYSVLAIPDNLGSARSLFYDIGKQYGEAQVVPVDGALLESLNFSKHETILFRSVDGQFTSVGPRNLRKAVIPLIRIFTDEVLKDEWKPIVALSAPELTNEIRSFLNCLAVEFKNFSFGFIPDDAFKLNIFSVRRSFSFDISGIFTSSFLSQGFEYETWLPLVRGILVEIESKVRNPIYISEDISDRMGQVCRITGKTYLDFINQDVDALLLFVSSSSPVSAVFRNFADECSSAVFAEIDIDRNSNDFPFIPSVPHVVLFPKNTKSRSQPLRGAITRSNLAFLLHQYGSKPLKVAAEPMSREEFRGIVLDLSNRVQEMPIEEQQKYYEWVKLTARFLTPERTARQEL